MDLFSLDSIILIIVICNCLPFSSSRSIFRRHIFMTIILIIIVLSFTNRLSCTSLYLSLKTSFVYSNLFSFSQTEEVWINETCLKAKIKASAWKTIRKTQYDNHEDYFQVFRGFSKKSYPEISSWQVLKIAFRSLQIWKLSGGGYTQTPLQGSCLPHSR